MVIGAINIIIMQLFFLILITMQLIGLKYIYLGRFSNIQYISLYGHIDPAWGSEPLVKYHSYSNVIKARYLLVHFTFYSKIYGNVY